MAFFRSIVEDYEAELAPAPFVTYASGARGKAEWERFGDGEVEFNLRFRGVELPDGTVVEVVKESQVVGSLTIEKGRAKLLLRKKDGVQIPAVRVGDTVEVRLAGVVLLQGKFRED